MKSFYNIERKNNMTDRQKRIIFAALSYVKGELSILHHEYDIAEWTDDPVDLEVDGEWIGEEIEVCEIDELLLQLKSQIQ